tara:strand:+ start:2140 stop:3363 length:1224 start_codon:yes stop_codon:yes gene_type:complete
VFNEFTLKNQTMWCDGYFNPHRYDHLGFDEYTLRHACFGDDGDQNDSGSDPGQGDFVGKDAEKDEAMPTDADYGGLIDASADGKGYGKGGNVATTAADVPGLVGSAVANMVAMDPYGGVGPNMNDILSGLTPEELGFGYLSQAQNPLIGRPDERMSREQLAQTYVDAKAGSQDIGSDIASLFGIQSPVMMDKERGFYEGTTFDPFDAPVLGLLASLNPITGAAYGLARGLARNDPIGGALSMLPGAPIVNTANTALSAYNLIADQPQTLSSALSVSSPFGLGTPDPFANPYETPQSTTAIGVPGYTSTNITFDPVGTVQGLGRAAKDTVTGALSNLISDPTAAKATYDPNATKSDPTVSDMQQQAIDAAAVDAAQAQAAAAAAAEAMFGPNYAPGEVYGVNPLGIGT